LAEETVLSYKEISEIVGTTEKTIYRTLKKYREEGTVADRPGRGRKRKISTVEAKRMVKKAKEGQPATQIGREYRARTKRDLHDQTVRNVLRDEGLKNLKVREVEELSKANKKKRLTYAREMHDYKWQRVFFSDEKTFWLGGGPSRMWQDPKKRVTRAVRRHPKKLHVWAAMGYYMKSDLFFFTENLTAKLYQKILRQHLQERKITFAPDCPAYVRQRWVFLQDNDPKHKAKKTMELLEEMMGNRMIEHPPSSPDLNPMEDAWSYLKRKIDSHRINKLVLLKRHLSKYWNKLSWEDIRKSIDSMPSRLKECKRLRGGRTQY